MRSYLRFIADHRTFLAFGLAAAFFSSFGQTFFVGQFNAAMRESFGLGHAQFGALYSIATLASAFVFVRVGRLIDDCDLRRYTVVVIVGCAAAASLVAGAWAPWVLLPAIFGLRLTGQGLLSHISATTMARYFDATRGKAMSIAGLGYPLGEALLPPLAVLAIATIGWRAAWAVIAAVILVAALPIMLGLLRGHERRHEAHESALREAERAASASGRDPARRSWTRGEVLRDLRFYMILPAALAAPFIVTGLFFHQNRLVEAKGWSDELFATSFTAFAIVQVVVSISAGPLIDRLGAWRIVRVLLLPLTAAMAVVATARSGATAYLLMALIGGTTGAAGAILGAMWAELYGVRHHGSIRAMTSSIGVVSTAGSPVLIGIALDQGIAMEAMAWMAAGWCAGATVLAWTALRRL